MKSLLPILLSLIILSEISLAQTSSSSVLSVKTDVISPFAFERPAFFIGGEYVPHPLVGIEFEYGLRIPAKFWKISPPSGFQNYRYQKFRFAVNLYPFEKGYVGETYIGVSIYGHPESFINEDDWMYLNQAYYSYEEAEINIQAIGWTVNFGKRYNITDRFFMQFIWGMGTKQVQVNYVASITPMNVPPVATTFQFNRHRVAGRSQRFHTYVSLKLGYTLVAKDRYSPKIRLRIPLFWPFNRIPGGGQEEYNRSRRP